MLDLVTTYPGQTAGATANYPNGEPRNVTISGDGTGTPVEAAIYSDWRGWMEAIVAESGVAISGNADTALVSDVLTGLKLLLLQRSELRSLGGNILTDDDRLSLEDLPGLTMTRDSVILMTVEAGARRNSIDTADMVFPAAFQKDISAPWAVGDGQGGMAGTLTADTWYRRMLVAKPDGTTDWCWSGDVDAADFFAGAAAISAGYSDTTLYRRFGWTLANASSQMDDHYSDVADPRRYGWSPGELDRGPSGPVMNNATRTAFTVSAPPSTLALLTFNAEDTGGTDTILISTEQQADGAVTQGAASMFIESGDASASLRGEWAMNSSSQIFGRTFGASGVTSFSILCDGWIDNGLGL